MKNKDKYQTEDEAHEAFLRFCDEWKCLARNFVHCANCPCLHSVRGCFVAWLFKEEEDVDRALRERRAASAQPVRAGTDEGDADA